MAVEKVQETATYNKSPRQASGMTAAERYERSRSSRKGSVYEPPPERHTFQNRLLAAFPPEDVRRFFSDLHPVSFPLRHVLYDVDAPLDHVYFIEQGLSSILMSMSNGSTIEVGMIGLEGMIGIQALLGGLTSHHQFIAQAPITALRMNTARCRAAFDQSAAVRRVMLRFTEVVLGLASQTAACNRLHSIEQRCARWLLMSSDRLHSDSIPMTHEFLASMLGVRRAGVTTTLGELDRSGVIENGRGRVTITDREGLEAAACECYQLDRSRLDRLL